MLIGAEALGRDRAAAVAALARRSSSTSRRSGGEPDDGIWEARGPQRHYTYSKVMAWVVFDRAVRIAERFGLEAPVDRWTRDARRDPRARSASSGYDAERRTFTQYYGSDELDASVLNIPLVGLPARRRRARDRHDRRGRARAGPRRLRLALLDRGDRRRPARRRGPVPGLLVLAGQRARAQRPRRRGAHAVRAAARPDQRPRPARRGVRRRRAGGRSATSRRRSATSRSSSRRARSRTPRRA